MLMLTCILVLVFDILKEEIFWTENLLFLVSENMFGIVTYLSAIISIADMVAMRR